jgi:hypothetical protein
LSDGDKIVDADVKADGGNFDFATGSTEPITKIVAKMMKSALRELLAPACLTRWRNIFIEGVPVSGDAPVNSRCAEA